jgi:D-glycerate 3-kinase
VVRGEGRAGTRLGRRTFYFRKLFHLDSTLLVAARSKTYIRLGTDLKTLSRAIPSNIATYQLPAVDPAMSSLDANIRRALDVLLPKIKKQREESSKPIVLGITGLQGSGKSTWAAKIVEILTSEHQLQTITVSLDDFYKTHDGLIQQRDQDLNNKLYRVRGQPGTHDEQLAATFFEELEHYNGEGKLRIPSFDKSRFNGEGDRAPISDWHSVTQKPDVVVFEGWCVGFQPLPVPAVKEKHSLALAGKLPVNTPAQHQISHILEVNENLKRYCDAFMGPGHFDFFVHIDTSDLRNVYIWRLEQEHKMIAAKGSGMSDDQVKAFIDGYMPSYEIYLDALRQGLFEDKGRMVRVVLDRQRSVEEVEEL